MLQGPTVPISTGTLFSDETLYEIEAKVSKDSRTTTIRILLDIITDNPPSILIL